MTSSSSMGMDETEKRESVQYRVLSEKIDQLAGEQSKVAVALARLETSMMSRHEIATAIAERISANVYLADQAALKQQLAEIKSAPQAAWVKGGILASGALGCLSLLVASAGVLIGALVAGGVIK